MNEKDHKMLSMIENNLNNYKFIHDDNLYNEFIKTKSNYIKIILLGSDDNESELNTQENDLTKKFNEYPSQSDQQLLNEYGKEKNDILSEKRISRNALINRSTGAGITLYDKPLSSEEEQNHIKQLTSDVNINERVLDRYSDYNDGNKHICKVYGSFKNKREILIKTDGRWLYYTNGYNDNNINNYETNIFELYIQNSDDKYSDTLSNDQKNSLARLYSSIYCLCFCIEWSLMVYYPYFTYDDTIEDFVNKMKKRIEYIYYPQYTQLKTDMLKIFNNMKQPLQIDNYYNYYSFLCDFGNSLAVTFNSKGNCYLTGLFPFYRNLFNLSKISEFYKYEKYMIKCNINMIQDKKYEKACKNAIKLSASYPLSNI
jgi:hypothetical protein